MLSNGQRAYLREFEKMLRRPEGIDFCMQLIDDLGVKLAGGQKRGRANKPRA